MSVIMQELHALSGPHLEMLNINGKYQQRQQRHIWQD
jgi:hypothetical protein